MVSCLPFFVVLEVWTTLARFDLGIVESKEYVKASCALGSRKDFFICGTVHQSALR